MKEEFICEWNGFAVWDAGNGTVDCYYEAKITLTPTGSISKDKELARLLKKNPFMTKESIQALFAKRLKDRLDYEFDDYCTFDDYYQPVVEDYRSNLEYDVTTWCNENGFELNTIEGSWRDSGYEPKDR